MQCGYCLGIGQGLGKIDYRYWIWQAEVLVLQIPEAAASLKLDQPSKVLYRTSGRSCETVVGPPKEGTGE